MQLAESWMACLETGTACNSAGTYSMFTLSHTDLSVVLFQTKGQRLMLPPATQMSVTSSCFLRDILIQDVKKGQAESPETAIKCFHLYKC